MPSSGNAISTSPQGPPGPLATSAASAALLTAFPTSILVDGAFAYLQSRTTVWTYKPNDSSAPDGWHIPAQGVGNWVYHSAGNPYATLASGNLYWDPAGISIPAGNDDATGLSGAPLSTFGEIQRRCGSNSPQMVYGRSLTIHQLSSQPGGVDPIIFEPFMPGGGNLALIGTLTPVGSTFAAGTVTAKARVAGASPMSVAGFPGGAAATMLVFNSTRGSWSTIDSVVGGVASMCQPFASAGLTTIQFPLQGGGTVLVEDDTWTAGDTLQIYSKPNANLKLFQARMASDSPSTSNKPVTWIQNIHVPDPSGLIGFSVLGVGGECNHVTSLCSFEPFVNSNIYASGYGIDGASTSAFFGCMFLGGGQFRFKHIVGGSTNSALKNFTNFNDGSVIDGDIILHGQTNVKGRYSDLGYALIASDGGVTVDHGAVLLIRPEWFSAALLYGNSFALSGPKSAATPSSTWVASLKVSSITMDGQTVGSYRSGSAWVDGIPLTSQNLDNFGGLQNTSTGSQFYAIAPIFTPALQVTDWYWDPVNGLDTNSGGIGFPVQHFAEIIRRYGTTEPIIPYGQSVTVHQLSAQPANSDPVFFEPKMSGGGQAVLLSTLVVLQSAFTGGTVTAKVKGGPGTRLQIASMPAGVAAKQLVFNQTRNSYAFVDSMAGQTATMQQPVAAAGITTVNIPAPAEDNTWTTGDTLIVYDCPLLNLASWDPVAVDENVGATKQSVGWVQFARIADSSGSAASVYGMRSRSVASVLSCCRVDARMVTSTQNGRSATGYLIGCTLASALNQYGGQLTIFGGGVAAGVNANGGLINLQGDVTLHGTNSTALGGLLSITAAFNDGNWGMTAPGGFQLLAAGAVWGSATVNLFPNAFGYNASGGTWVNAWLSSGAMQIGGATTASAYGGSGAITDGVTINPTNIDSGGAGGPGLFNVKTGARYCNAA
jgi:hypothetical protein